MKHCQFKEWKKSLQYIHFRGKESLSLLDFWFELLKKHCSLKVQLFYMYCSSFLSCFKQSSLSRIVVNGRLEMLFFFQAQFYTPSCNGMPASGYIQERLLNIQRGISQQKKRASNHKSKPPGKKPRTVLYQVLLYTVDIAQSACFSPIEKICLTLTQEQQAGLKC